MPTEEICPASETTPAIDIPIHEVKDNKGNLLGHMIVIGSFEVAGCLTPLLLQFGLSPEGIANSIGVLFLSSPAVLPVLLFIDVCGSFSLISLEMYIKHYLNPKKE